MSMIINATFVEKLSKMILDILLIIASYLAFFFSVIILLKKNKHVSDYYLSAWLLVLSIFMVMLSIETTLSFVIRLLHSIFLFLYIKSITSESISTIKKGVYFLPCIILFPFSFYPDLLAHPVFSIIHLIITSIFIFASYVQLRKYLVYLNKNYANVEYADINWLNLLFYGNVFFYAVGILSNFFDFIPEKAIYAVTLFLFMNITGLKAIMQNVVFIKRPAENIEKTNNETYVNYGLKSTEAEKLAQKLQQYMEIEKPYINPELCLNNLSIALDVYPHYITQVLSTVFNQNFYDYINTYRVEEAKKQLKDPKKSNFTILSIAFDCGFNSKTAFNRAFKQKTSQTPSEFRSSDN